MISLAGRFLGLIGRLIYAVYGWSVFALAILAAILIALLVPGLDRRRRGATAAARSFFVLAGIPARVYGIDQIPDANCIVVANHTSYLDGVIMQAFLPPRFSFVIKGELQRVPIMHFLLRRMGSKFVERFIAAGSTRDARLGGVLGGGSIAARNFVSVGRRRGAIGAHRRQCVGSTFAAFSRQLRGARCVSSCGERVFG